MAAGGEADLVALDVEGLGGGLHEQALFGLRARLDARRHHELDAFSRLGGIEEVVRAGGRPRAGLLWFAVTTCQRGGR